MTFKILINCFSIFLLLSCSAGSNEDINNTSIISKAIPVYNEAYQENFEADNLTTILNEAKNAYVLIDPFEGNIATSIAQIKARGNTIGAYISIGTGENWRADFNQMQPYLVSQSWGQWPNEYFVKIITPELINILKTRIDKIANWGCDWVEFDNMDWVYDDDLRATYNFTVTQQEGVAYYKELCDYVHQKGMKCMAKNTVENATNFDGVLYESYHNDKNWWDVSGAKNFLAADKLVIVNHYNETKCTEIYNEYKGIYNNNLSFICEDRNLKKYVHFNQ
ncbi:MAG: endo alpha-1,4 polygalactosaminidase [Flavobacteriaceae bacterium]